MNNIRSRGSREYGYAAVGRSHHAHAAKELESMRSMFVIKCWKESKTRKSRRVVSDRLSNAYCMYATPLSSTGLIHMRYSMGTFQRSRIDSLVL